MRKLLWFMILILLFAACRSDDPSQSSDGSNNGDGNGAVVVEAPRIEDTPVPTNTPIPTPFPLPTRENPDHVFPVATRTIHTIQYGDTLSKIASQYDVTIKSISDANRHYDFDYIIAGDQLYIPLCEEPEEE
jgi:LysM repeat protein